MRTTFAPLSLRARDVPARPGDVREWVAKSLAVFFRSSFGEQYLNPLSLVRTAALVATPLLVARFFISSQASGVPATRVFWLTAGFFVICGLVAVHHRRFVLAGLLALSVVAIYVGTTINASFCSFAAIVAPRTRIAFLLFFLAFVVVASVRMIRVRARPAPHRLAAGTSSRIWLAIPGWLRPWKDDWDLQLYLEPLIVATAGVLLWFGFANWFGAFLLLASLLMHDAARHRYDDARSRIVHAVSGMAEMEQHSAAVKEATTPDPSPARPQFIAQRAAPKSGGS